VEYGAVAADSNCTGLIGLQQMCSKESIPTAVGGIFCIKALMTVAIGNSRILKAVLMAEGHLPCEILQKKWRKPNTR